MRRSDRLSVSVLCGLSLATAACTANSRSDTGLADRGAGASIAQPAAAATHASTPAVSEVSAAALQQASAVASTAVTTDPLPSAGCVLEKADAPVNVAFCETFDQPAPVLTRSGQLDQTLWGVSRLNTFVNPSQGLLNNYYPTSIIGCGLTAKVMAPNDVRICNGRVYESANDMEGQTTVALYPKQPMDFTGRTGTVSFDVNLDSQGPHAAWPEFWITDKPIPAPSDGRASNYSYARHQFGVTFGLGCGVGYSGVDRVSIVRNYKLEHITFANPLPYVEGHGQCFKSESATGRLNHVEIRMSATNAEVWVREPGATRMRLVASATLDMPLTKGLIWLVDAHYNANKFDTQGDHTFAWDNVAFDGPKTYRDLGFDVPDAHTPARVPNVSQLGYNVEQKPVAFTIPGVYRKQPPTGALMVFNYFVCVNNIVPSFRVNGGPWHDTPSPYTDQCGWRSIDVSVPVSEIRDGANAVEFKAATGWAVLTNISLILVAGAAVP
jgi:hypothetical protein